MFWYIGEHAGVNAGHQAPGEHDPAISGRVINHSPEIPEPDRRTRAACWLFSRESKTTFERPPGISPGFIIINNGWLYTTANVDHAHPPLPDSIKYGGG